MDEMDPDQPSKGAKALKIIGIIAGALVLLLIAVYFVATSSGFVTGVILPKAGASLNAKITASSASVSPFSQIVLQDLKIQTTGSEPVLAAKEVRARYSLMSILRGNIKVDEVTLNSPTVRIVQTPNGSNLDPLMGKKSGQPSSSGSSKTPELDIHNVTIKDGDIQIIQIDRNENQTSTRLSHLELGIDQIQNDQSGKLTINTGLNMEKKPKKTSEPGGSLEGNAQGSIQFAITSDLKPKSASGQIKTSMSQAQGSFAQIKGLTMTLNTDLTPTDLKDLSLRFEQNGNLLGVLRVSGPVDLAKTEGRFKIQLSQIDRQLLNAAGVGSGWDFGKSTFGTTNLVDVSEKGNVIHLSGNLSGQNLSVTQTNLSTPPVDLSLEYQTELNLNDKSAIVQKFTVNGSKQGNLFLHGSLDRPMNLSWGNSLRGYKESAFVLQLTNFNVAEWQTILGSSAKEGIVNFNLQASSGQDGKVLKADWQLSGQKLSVVAGTNTFTQVDLTVSGQGTLEQMKQLSVSSLKFNSAQAGQTLVDGSGAINYNMESKKGSVQVTANVSLPTALREVALTNVNLSAGNLNLNTTIEQDAGKKTITGTIGLLDLTGKVSNFALNHYNVNLDFNTGIAEDSVEIYVANLALKQGFSSGGVISVKGNYGLKNKVAAISYKLADINEAGLLPFLEPSLGAKKLSSVLLAGSGDLKYNPASDTIITTSITLTNLVVQDPEKKIPNTPLSAGVDLDASLNGNQVDLRNLSLHLNPTERATNDLQVVAKLDLGKTNPNPSSISINSSGLDVTSFYDLLSGKTNQTTSAATKTAPPANGATVTSATATNAEPGAISLPFEQLTFDLKIARFYLRELAITNLTAAAKINKGMVTIQPLQLTLNGAPIQATANLNLGTPGYTYDLNFSADRVPLDPLVRSFAKTNQQGALQGTFIANANLKGAGVTGVNLKKNLQGNVSAVLTNMQVQALSPKWQRLLEPIAIVLQIPELTASPIQTVNLVSKIGEGQVNLDHLYVWAEAFKADAHGTIPIADVLTNSPLNLPVDFALSHNLAQKARLLPANTPADAQYVSLPTFIRLEGTIGDFKTKTDKLVIGGLLARSLGNIGGLGGKTGSVLNNISGVLTGQEAASASNNTNAPSAQQNLIQGIGSLLGARGAQPTAPATTNNATPPATSAPTNTTTSPANPLDLFKLLPKKK